MVQDSFKRNKQFEITQMLKGIDQEYAYVVASSPDQRSKILTFSLAVEGELITPTPTRVKLAAATIVRKNCLVFIAKNLNKGLSSALVEEGLKTLIGEKNVISVYYPRAKGEMHIGIANVELLNTPIYKKIVNKTHKVQNNYVHFNPHPRSLDGTTAPSEESLQEWSFKDLNIALAITVKALENTTTAPKQQPAAKGEISTLVKEAIAVGTQTLKLELKADMQILREDILAESHTYTDIMWQDLRSKIDGQFDNIDNQFKALMESLSTTRKMLHDTP
jgi:hypothetical protein